MKKLLLLSILAPFFTWSQITQTVKGRVLDNETQVPLIGARILITTADTAVRFQGVTNMDG